MIKLPFAVVAMVAGLAIQPAMAKILRGDAFVTAMQDNTLTGKNAAGTAFNMYFLPGGQVTYQESGGKLQAGTWKIDKDGDVCVGWQSPATAKAGCFRVESKGSELTWSDKDGTFHSGLRGEVTPMKMSKKTQ